MKNKQISTGLLWIWPLKRKDRGIIIAIIVFTVNNDDGMDIDNNCSVLEESQRIFVVAKFCPKVYEDR